MRLGACAALLLAAALISCAGCGGPAEPDVPPNLLVLSVDSLRADRPAAFGGPVETPAMASLAARGTSFSNAWATAPWTAPSMVSVFTGLYPPSHGVVHRDDTTPAELSTVFTVLADEGYRVGNLAFFSTVSYFAGLGLPDPDPTLGEVRPPEAFASWLAAGEGPFAAWVHLVEPHLPYGATGWSATDVSVPGSTGLERSQLRADVPVGSVEFERGDRERLLELYDRDVRAADAAVGDVLAALEAAGVVDRTLVVLVADHGEELLEHGWVGHASTAVEARLVPEVLRIPLVLAGPGVPAGVRSDALVQQVDLLPTVLRLLDLPLPDGFDGRLIRLSSRGTATGRHHVFFDSSAGGHLTPADRRAERYQGATDGRWIVERHYLADGRVRDATRPARPGVGVAPLAASLQRMRTALASWQERQARRRLGRLHGERDQRPPPDAIAALEESLVVLRPTDEGRLEWQDTGGVVEVDWEGGGPAWVEYAAGDGPLAISGAFRVGGPPLVLGPFPRGFWNDVAAHGPYRFRVVDLEAGERSRWIGFEVARVD